MTLPIFVLARTPGAAETVEWTDVCHGQRGRNFLFIQHEPGRNPSRWTYADNKRPFIAYTREWHKLGASATLEGALKIAQRHVATLTPAKPARGCPNCGGWGFSIEGGDCRACRGTGKVAA